MAPIANETLNKRTSQYLILVQKMDSVNNLLDDLTSYVIIR